MRHDFLSLRSVHGRGQTLARSLFVFAIFLLSTFLLVSPVAATPGTITDTTTGTATNNGTVNVGEYVGSTVGINNGFGNVIGSASQLHIDSSHTGALNFGLITGALAFGGNDAMVIYIDTDNGASGFADTSGFTDMADNCRRAISGFDGTNRSTLTFATGFQADYAICIDNGFAGLWELVNGGSHTFVTTVNRTTSAANNFEMNLTMANLGLTAGDSFRYVATYLNSASAFRSDEFHGVTAFAGGNPGQNPATLAAGDFITFNSCGNLVTNSDTGETFCSIQAAIDDSDTDAGDTIVASAGTYVENVTVNKALTLQGPNIGIHPEYGVRNAEAVIDGLITLGANNVTIEGFQLTNPAGSAIRGGVNGTVNYSGITIQYNDFDTLDEFAVVNGFSQGGNAASPASNWSINNNKVENITGNDRTVFALFNLDNLMVSDNYIRHTNGAATGRRGLNIDSVQGATIQNNDISLGFDIQGAAALNDSFPFVRYNIQLSMSDRATSDILIEGNTFDGSYDGIVTLAQNPINGITIRDNTFTTQLGFGLRTMAGSNNIAGTHANFVVDDNIFASLRHTAVRIDIGANAPYTNIRVINNAINDGLVGIFANGVSAAGEIVFAGNTVTGPDTALSVGTSRDLVAYANTITGATTGINNLGTVNARHNWWGTYTTQPAGVDNNSWDYRLGAPISSWSDTTTLGSASLTAAGGSGTGVIVSHGRGLANVPFGAGLDPFASAMCSDYYDFFVLNPAGNWTVSVPIDGGCVTPTLYQFALTGDQPDTACVGGACWEPTGAVNGGNLEVTVIAGDILQGTPFVAGGDVDPTAVTLSGFGTGQASAVPFALLFLLLVVITSSVLWRQKASVRLMS